MSQDKKQNPTAKSTTDNQYKDSVSNNENRHEEDDLEKPSRATKREGVESQQDRADRKDREQHPNR